MVRCKPLDNGVLKLRKSTLDKCMRKAKFKHAVFAGELTFNRPEFDEKTNCILYCLRIDESNVPYWSGFFDAMM